MLDRTLHIEILKDTNGRDSVDFGWVTDDLTDNLIGDEVRVRRWFCTGEESFEIMGRDEACEEWDMLISQGHKRDKGNKRLRDLL